MHACMSVSFVCGYVGMRVCDGYVGMRVRGYVSMWLCGYVCACACGYACVCAHANSHLQSVERRQRLIHQRVVLGLLLLRLFQRHVTLRTRHRLDLRQLRAVLRLGGGEGEARAGGPDVGGAHGGEVELGCRHWFGHSSEFAQHLLGVGRTLGTEACELVAGCMRG